MSQQKELIDKALSSLNAFPDSIYKRVLVKTAPLMLEVFTEEITQCRGEQVIDFAHEYPRVLAYYMKTARASLRYSFEDPIMADAIEAIMHDSFSEAMNSASRIVGEMKPNV